MVVKYATRETVARALDAMETAYAYDQIDRALEAASRTIEGPEDCNRRFYPEVVTLRFDHPEVGHDSYYLPLDEHELISLTSLTYGDDDTVVAPSDYGLEPVNEGPPFDSIKIASWYLDATAVGVRGYRLDSRPAGTLAAAVVSTSATTITVTDGHAIGVGELLTIGTERLEVTDRQLVDTTEDLAGHVDAEASTTTIPVTDGSAFTAGEEITVDAETMLIAKIAGDNLIVKRAVAGSVLAAHTSGSSVYAARALTVTRGALGTTAATHLIGATITAQVYPGPVVAGVVAMAMTQILNEQAGYAGRAASGEAARQASVADTARKMARAAVGRAGRLFC